ncbi:MAG: hypothetical protein ACTTH7_02035 [Treponema sp.]
MLKALILAYDGELQKTHDLGLLVDELSEFVTFSEDILNAADSDMSKNFSFWTGSLD